MAKVPLDAIVSYCEAQLNPSAYRDAPRAMNGLQVENYHGVSHVAAAVDATLPVVELAIAADADLLIVHHGLFWSGSAPWTGRRRRLLQRLVECDLAIYSQHLPLDGHRRWGNAAQLASALGLPRRRQPFFHRDGVPIGVRVEPSTPTPRVELAARLGALVGRSPVVVPGGPVLCRKIGLCTGAAGGDLEVAALEGVDTLITGEGPHWSYGHAEDLGINVIYGGHYATETFGVKALATAVSQKFRIPWTFVDHPTGL